MKTATLFQVFKPYIFVHEILCSICKHSETVLNENEYWMIIECTATTISHEMPLVVLVSSCFHLSFPFRTCQCTMFIKLHLKLSRYSAHSAHSDINLTLQAMQIHLLSFIEAQVEHPPEIRCVHIFRAQGDMSDP